MVHLPVASPRTYGEVFTRRWVVDTLMDLTGYVTSRDLGALTLVEPSAGTGAFLIPVIERLLESAKRYKRDPHTLFDSIRAWELQARNVQILKMRVRSVLRAEGIDTTLAEHLTDNWVIEGDFLRPEGDLFTPGSGTITADIVLGNPPYIRIEDLAPEVTFAYRRRWSTMSGRADIYVGFIERALSILLPGGKVGFICADRWMRNQYGAKIRHFVTDGFAVDAVWIMHDVDAFESKVSAYPAITVFRRGAQGSVVVAATTDSFDKNCASELLIWSRRNNESEEFRSQGVVAHRLPHWFSGEESWPSGSPAQLGLVTHLNDHFDTLQNPSTGTRVGIGVATGADKVFITPNAELAEPDRLLRLAMSQDVRSGNFRWSGNHLLNPWAPDGSLVDLAKYPRLKDHFDEHAQILKRRHTALKSPHSWYKTIDRVNHQLIDKPKLLIPDMSLRLAPVLDTGGYYPHHNLYYIVSDEWDLEVLGGLMMSEVAQRYLEAYCVKMRGGTLRFQSQYLKRLRVPDPASLSCSVKASLRNAFRSRDHRMATQAAAEAYRMRLEEFDIDVAGE